jgi:succinyldiaminopimelate transaminase
MAEFQGIQHRVLQRSRISRWSEQSRCYRQGSSSRGADPEEAGEQLKTDGFSLPDFPWDLLAPYGAKAREHHDGAIDLSQGTPVDPTPDFIREALESGSDSPGYPVTTGSPQLREAIHRYCIEVLGASGEFDFLPTIGSKELVAWLPFLLRSKHVVIPKIAYPTYRVGGLLAGAKITEVEIDATTWPTLDQETLVWINTPSNPTGRVHDRDEISRVLAKRQSGAVIASDECYFSFPDSKLPISTFEVAAGDNKNLLLVHSLSKRSNIAGYRGAFIAGDSELIARLLEIRKHAGMMMPAPIQRASAIALADEEHVRRQAERYLARRATLIPALILNGFAIEHSTAGLYIWCSDGRSDWEQVAWFAERGVIVTPGRFYGEAGERHIRIALTATDDAIERVVERISAGALADG